MEDVQVVVDAIDPANLVSTTTTKTFDFATITEQDLHDIEIPIDLQSGRHKVPQTILIYFEEAFVITLSPTGVHMWLTLLM